MKILNMPPQYKLLDFDFGSRGELVRLVFAQAGVEFVDERIDKEDQRWHDLEPRTPFGLLPVLEVDGRMLGGCTVIARYVAENHGVAGSNDFENAFLASIVDADKDLLEHYANYRKEEDEGRKAQLKKQYDEEHVPTTLGYFQKLAAGNNCRDGWLYGPRPTYADLAVYLTLTRLQPEVVGRFTALSRLKKSVEKLPNIAKWVAEHPKTGF